MNEEIKEGKVIGVDLGFTTYKDTNHARAKIHLNNVSANDAMKAVVNLTSDLIKQLGDSSSDTIKDIQLEVIKKIVKRKDLGLTQEECYLVTALLDSLNDETAICMAAIEKLFKEVQEQSESNSLKDLFKRM